MCHTSGECRNLRVWKDIGRRREELLINDKFWLLSSPCQSKMKDASKRSLKNYRHKRPAPERERFPVPGSGSAYCFPLNFHRDSTFLRSGKRVTGNRLRSRAGIVDLTSPLILPSGRIFAIWEFPRSDAAPPPNGMPSALAMCNSSPQS